MNRLGALRMSLLLAVGVVPVACGGTTQRRDDDEDYSSGSGGGGTSSSGGTRTRAGTGSGGVGKMLPPTAGAAVGGATQTPPSCTSPIFDPLSGLTKCEEGYEHRSKQIECQGFGGAIGTDRGSGGGGGSDTDPPRADGSVSCGPSAEGGAGGVTDCEDFELGYCAAEDGFISVCLSGCWTDVDCGGGAICECGHPESPSGGVCVDAADCQTDADCAAGSLCASYSGGCGYHAYACLAAKDECQGNADCMGGYCEYDINQSRRVCNSAVCGRPFLVEQTARVAQVVQSRDWRGPVDATPTLDHLSQAERAASAEHWSRLGQMEHASIAAFARFSLQLLALGAPSELVEQCTQALADETAHTKLCFQLASAYAGRALGPGALDVSRSLEPTSLQSIVDLVIAEGCFGETSAALDARQAADQASDPVIAAAYARIADDEQRHAELAFRFVRWAFDQDRATVCDSIRAALASDLASSKVGLQVVRPCLSSLLNLHPSS